MLRFSSSPTSWMMRLRGLKRDFSPVTPRLQPKASTLSFPLFQREAMVRTAAAASMLSSFTIASTVNSSPSFSLVRATSRSCGVFSLKTLGIRAGPRPSAPGGGSAPRRASRGRLAAISISFAVGGRPSAYCHASSTDFTRAASFCARASGQSPFTQQQRLRRRRGALPLGGAGEARGRVEAAQQLVLAVALLGRVDRAARAVAVGRRAACLEVEFAAGREHRVAHLLGIEPARIEAPEVFVRRDRSSPRSPARRDARSAGRSPRAGSRGAASSGSSRRRRSAASDSRAVRDASAPRRVRRSRSASRRCRGRRGSARRGSR